MISRRVAFESIEPDQHIKERIDLAGSKHGPLGLGDPSYQPQKRLCKRLYRFSLRESS